MLLEKNAIYSIAFFLSVATLFSAMVLSEKKVYISEVANKTWRNVKAMRRIDKPESG